jgi:hypothetical protein
MITNQNELETFINSKPFNSYGDKLIDFSGVGCKTPPSIIYTVYVSPSNSKDDDYIGEIFNFFKGNIELLLEAGEYFFCKPLEIKYNNVVITALSYKTDVSFIFNCPQTCKSLINISGTSWNKEIFSKSNILNGNVPVGSNSIRIPMFADIDKDDNIVIHRKSNEKWFQDIGINSNILPLKNSPHSPKSIQLIPFALEYHRKVLDVKQHSLFKELILNADIPCAIDTKWGGGYCYKYINNRIHSIHISNLNIITGNENIDVITLDNCEHVKLSNLVFNPKQEINSNINMGSHTQYVTIKRLLFKGVNNKCLMLGGQMNLISKCNNQATSLIPIYTQSYTCGPNVVYKFISKILKINSSKYKSFSQLHTKYSVGLLFDLCNCPLQMCNAFGSNITNSIIWNCSDVGINENVRKTRNIYYSKDQWTLFKNTPESIYRMQMKNTYYKKN